MALKNIQMPDLGEGVTEGEIIKVHVKTGDTITLDQPLLEVMTDKASMEVPSLLSGNVKEVHIKEGDMVAVGSTLIVVQVQGNKSEPDEQAVPQKETSTPNKTSVDQNKAPTSQTKCTEQIPSQEKENQNTLASPSTRRLAEELGINLKDISPSGKEGQILRTDLLNYIQANQSHSPKSSSSTTRNLCDLEEGDRTEPVRGIQRIMSETMSLSKRNIPHFTIIEEACMNRLIDIRSQLKPDLEKENIKLTYLPFIMKSVLTGIKDYPIFNSQFDDTKQSIIYRRTCNLGFAVDTSQGLIVPVIKNAKEKSLLTLAKELQDLGQKAREGRLSREELTGGTFTLSNLGSIGGIYGTPIIQPPQVAILGIYRFNKKLRKVNGNIEEKTYASFSITCDHRVIDGAKATRFLCDLILKIEEPERLLLN